MYRAILYTLTFSRWIPFRVFRKLVSICENKNRKSLLVTSLRTRHIVYLRKFKPRIFRGAKLFHDFAKQNPHMSTYTVQTVEYVWSHIAL